MANISLALGIASHSALFRVFLRWNFKHFKGSDVSNKILHLLNLLALHDAEVL